MSLECLEMFAPTPSVTKGERIILTAHPKGKTFVYASNKCIVIRDVENPKKCEVYTGHKKNTTVAQYAPSGNYICSGDIAGNLRIWATDSDEYKLKIEFERFLPAPITDICWGPESKRIAACGKVGAVLAKVVSWDSGNKLGDLDGVSVGANSISYKQTRPYRIAVGTENKDVAFFCGPPFKYDKLERRTNYVHSVRFSPDGKYLASAGLDKKILLSDGKTFDNLGECCDGETAHWRGINVISWSPDSKELLSASGDMTAKIWNVESKELAQKFVMGDQDQDQQVSCLWVGNYILSVSLSGDINYLDRNDPSKPARIIHGHTLAVQAISVLDKNTFFSGDSQGKILKWDIDSGVATMFSGPGHTSVIRGLYCDRDNNKLVSVGWDDKIRFTCMSSLDFSTAESLALDGQPKNLGSLGDDMYAVLTVKGITLIKNKKVVFTIPHAEEYESEQDSFIPTGFAATSGRIAVEAKNCKVKIFSVDGDALVLTTEFKTFGQAIKMDFSPDGSKLAVASDKRIQVFEAADNYTKYSQYNSHSSKIVSLAWSPSGNFLASSAMDSRLLVWKNSRRYAEVEAPHKEGVNTIVWLNDDHHLLTGGNDCFSKIWKVVW